MDQRRRLRRRQSSAVFVALLLFALLLFLLQLWLFVATLESLLAGHYVMAVPAAFASVAILGINIWMLRGVISVDRRG